jgi:hypothetical protein
MDLSSAQVMSVATAMAHAIGIPADQPGAYLRIRWGERTAWLYATTTTPTAMDISAAEEPLEQTATHWGTYGGDSQQSILWAVLDPTHRCDDPDICGASFIARAGPDGTLLVAAAASVLGVQEPDLLQLVTTGRLIHEQMGDDLGVTADSLWRYMRKRQRGLTSNLKG